MAETCEVVIGLEIHVQLKTASKMFCGCSTKFGSAPNSQTCPVCLGLPGVLPVINARALELAVKTALALNCRICPEGYTKFDRKNYYYPDLPKNYQISQYDIPLSTDGYLDILLESGTKRIGITRVHLEEDAGKLVHLGAGGRIGTAEESLVDLNRTGIPLLEIVSEPDLRSADEAYQYLVSLKNILQYLDVSDCNMEEGSLRCDANLSVRPRGQKELGIKTEIKNMNSFKGVQKALEFESKRQAELLEQAGKIVQETRLWDEKEQITYSMRGKEGAEDYRYFPEPDLMPVFISEETIGRIKAGLPELPGTRRARFVKEYGLPEYDAGVLTASRSLADYYETVVKAGGAPKPASNYVMVNLAGFLNDKNLAIEQSPVTPDGMAGLLKLIESNRISTKTAKDVFAEMFSSGKSAEQIVGEKNLGQISDEKTIAEIAEKVIAANQKTVEEFKSGKSQALGFLVGQVMKASQGKANPQMVNRILKEKIH